MSRVGAEEALLEVLRGIPDPEVPALDIVELGIVRRVELRPDGAVAVEVTPTYSGCPAMRVIEDDITTALREAGAAKVRVNTVFHPVWTTDWISEDARERLRAYGIAPPMGTAPVTAELIPLQRRVEVIPCPRCGSRNTELRSDFGSTACKAIWYCVSCTEPFEYLKAI